MSAAVEPRAGERIALGPDEDFAAMAHAAGWTDGLPVVAPTEERVAAMVGGRDGLEVLGVMAPGRGVATVEAVAVNAVMAGCDPAHMPVVVAAIRAMLEPEFNLYGVLTTTNPIAPAVMVSGPVVGELGFAAGHDCFGPASRANAVVGRAVRFCARNIGFARPGSTDMSTQGQPGKYGLCFAENQAANPWEPHHVDRGFPAGASCVTVFQGSMLVNLLDGGSESADSLLASFADPMSATNTNNMQLGEGDLLLVLCPEHAATLARDGLSKDDIRRELHRRTRRRADTFPPGILACVRSWRARRYADAGPDTLIEIADSPQDIHVVVAGGEAGAHSCFVPGFGDGRSVCVAL